MKISKLLGIGIENKGIKQTELAEKIGVDRLFINRIVNENSKSIKEIDKLFEELFPDISAEQLIKFIDLIRELKKEV